MRVAVAGLGGAFARGHLSALAQLERERELTLVGVADPDASRRSAVRDQLAHVAVFADADDMLASVSSDVLVIATEPAAHAILVALGVQHGVHVLCEKPLTVTEAQHDIVVRACAQRPDLAVVPVHQYRYSPQWVSIARWARCAGRLRVPYSLVVDVHRNGTDSHAASGWRSDIAAAGGMLADAGVHFLALAWTLREQLEVLAGVRGCDQAGGERSAATVQLGSGVLTIRVWSGAPIRRTCVELRLKRAAITWHDRAVRFEVCGRTLLRRDVDALSDRSHVDALYLPLYRDLVEHLRHDAWRARRTAEALEVSAALVTLLKCAPIDAGVAVA
jgi:predicted dehydrogenase